MGTKITARSPDNLKLCISSFIANGERIKETTVHDGDGLCTERSEERSTSDQTIKAQAYLREREAFQKRISTYKQMTWCAKPVWLSPPCCARYGWINVGVDLLQCVSCSAFMTGKMPSSASDLSVYKACCLRLATSLKTSHKSLCPWISYPCHDSFLGPPLGSQLEMQNEVRQRIKALRSLGDMEPLLEQDALDGMDISMEDLQTLTTLLNSCTEMDSSGMDICEPLADSEGTDVSCGQQCSEQGQEMCDEQVDTSVVCPTISREQMTTLIALFGWNKQPGNIPQLHCDFCDRRVGLWNYHSYHSVAHPESEDESIDELEDNEIKQNEEMNDETEKEKEDNELMDMEGELNEPQSCHFSESLHSCQDDIDINSMVRDLVLHVVDNIVDHISCQEDNCNNSNLPHTSEETEITDMSVSPSMPAVEEKDKPEQVIVSNDSNVILLEHASTCTSDSIEYLQESGAKSPQFVDRIVTEILEDLIQKTVESQENKKNNSMEEESVASAQSICKDILELHIPKGTKHEDIDNENVVDVPDKNKEHFNPKTAESGYTEVTAPQDSDLENIKLGVSKESNDFDDEPKFPEGSSTGSDPCVVEESNNGEGDTSNRDSCDSIQPEGTTLEKTNKEFQNLDDISTQESLTECKSDDAMIDVEHMNSGSAADNFEIINLPQDGKALDDFLNEEMKCDEDSSKEITECGEGSVDYSPVASIVSDIESDEVKILDDSYDKDSVNEIEVYYMSSSENECDILEKDTVKGVESKDDTVEKLSDNSDEASKLDDDSEKDIPAAEGQADFHNNGVGTGGGIKSEGGDVINTTKTSLEQGAGDSEIQNQRLDKLEIPSVDNGNMKESTKQSPSKNDSMEGSSEYFSINDAKKLGTVTSVTEEMSAQDSGHSQEADMESVQPMNQGNEFSNKQDVVSTPKNIEVSQQNTIEDLSHVEHTLDSRESIEQLSETSESYPQKTFSEEENSPLMKESIDLPPLEQETNETNETLDDTSNLLINNDEVKSKTNIVREEEANFMDHSGKCLKRKLSETQDSLQDGSCASKVTLSSEIQEPVSKKRKKPKIHRSNFSPVNEHRSWCPWVLVSKGQSVNTSLEVHDQANLPCHPGWRKLVDVLLKKKKTPQKSQHVPLSKTTPPHITLRNIRHLLNDWTAHNS